MSRSVLPDILDRLEFYLDRKDREWQAQPEGTRKPTLPHLGHQVCVRDMLRELDMRITWEQHFYDKKEIYSVINPVAAAQGLNGIKSRTAENNQHKVVREKIRNLNKTQNELSETLAERESLIENLRAENASLREQLGLQQQTG